MTSKLEKLMKTKKFKRQLALAIARTQFGARVRDWRKNIEKITQEELAKKAGTTQRIISEIENGTYNPTLELMARIYLSMDLGVLMVKLHA